MEKPTYFSTICISPPPSWLVVVSVNQSVCLVVCGWGFCFVVGVISVVCMFCVKSIVLILRLGVIRLCNIFFILDVSLCLWFCACVCVMDFLTFCDHYSKYIFYWGFVFVFEYFLSSFCIGTIIKIYKLSFGLVYPIPNFTILCLQCVVWDQERFCCVLIYLYAQTRALFSYLISLWFSRGFCIIC